MTFSVAVVNNITKEYPEMIKVVIYKEPQFFVRSGRNKRNKDDVDDTVYLPQISSLNRTKQTIRDIVLCNEFDLFCTFTFDPNKVDSTRFPSCRLCMSTWLHHQRNKSREAGKEFKYLIIPEQHKSGRWHFHALISGYTGRLKDSGIRSASLRPVYNITSFYSGFTTAVEIDNKEGVSSYVTKYITKDFIKYFNQRRFFCSRNLSRPKKSINSSIFKRSPLFFKQVADNGSSMEFVMDKFDSL